MVLPDTEEVREIQARLQAIAAQIKDYGQMAKSGILPSGDAMTKLADENGRLISRLNELRLDK